MTAIDLLIEQLDREDIEQARRMTGAEKLRACGDLFDDACRWTLAGIRRERPGIDEDTALAVLRDRVRADDEAEG